MKILKSILVFIFILAMSVPAIAIISQPDKSYSENENRYLQPRPAFSLSNAADGSFQRDADKWLSDQFPARDNLMSTGSLLKVCSGRRDIGDVYIGREGFLFEKKLSRDIDRSLYADNLKRMHDLTLQHPESDFRLMLIPSGGTVADDRLPDYASEYDFAELISQAKELFGSDKVIDIYCNLKSMEDEAFYKTDHHWTTDAAYIGYRTLMGEDAGYDINKAPLINVASDFLGTLYSKTLLPDQSTDDVRIADINRDVSVIADGEPGQIYDMSALNKKDKYSVFFGGNYGLVTIEGTGSKTLLLIKDSFANCLAPFMTADYGRILMIDLRYYPASVNDLITSESPDDILVLYEISNFASDRNIAKLAL